MTERIPLIVDAVRTRSGRGRSAGQLAGAHPVDLLAGTFADLLSRCPALDPERLDDVIVGCVTQAGEQAGNIARSAALAAGVPEKVPATTVDRQCGSSMQALAFAAQGIVAGAYDAVLVGGVESMSRVPMRSDAGSSDVDGDLLRRRYPAGFVNQGVAAELVAARWELDRQALDRFSVRSHELAAAATHAGRFSREVIGTPGGGAPPPDETLRVDCDEAGLAALRPAFYDAALAGRFPEIEWNITAGNSSPLTDGAAACLLVEAGLVERLGFGARARYVDGAVTGDDPLLMLMGVVPATRALLERTRMTVADIDAFEVNEAFASVPLAWQREVGADPDTLNQHGGAIALGHPLGSSGLRILATLLGVLEHTGGRFGLQTMCEAGGMANAHVIERL